MCLKGRVECYEVSKAKKCPTKGAGLRTSRQETLPESYLSDLAPEPLHPVQMDRQEEHWTRNHQQPASIREHTFPAPAFSPPWKELNQGHGEGAGPQRSPALGLQQGPQVPDAFLLACQDADCSLDRGTASSDCPNDLAGTARDKAGLSH